MRPTSRRRLRRPEWLRGNGSRRAEVAA